MPDSTSSDLPSSIVQAIAISNTKSIGEQPAILANLALANQILNNNLQQQIWISQQQALNQIAMATMAKCVSLIVGAPSTATTTADLKDLFSVMKEFASNLPAAPSVPLTPPLPASPPPVPGTSSSRVSPPPTAGQDAASTAAVAPTHHSDADKVIGEQTAMLSNLAYANAVANVNLMQQNAVANQQAMNELGIAVVGKTVNLLSKRTSLEARSAVDVLTNNELAGAIADLKATLESVQANATK
jgi:hypothetical protein